MKIKNKIAELTAIGLMIGSSAFAQTGGSVGGGRFSEVQLKGFMTKLETYFRSEDSHTLFPEVREYNLTHQPNFAQLVASIEPKVVSHAVYSHGEERDCVSMIEGNRRYFECNEAKLPEATLNNQPLLYSLLAHEAFVHAGLEHPSNTVVSEYPLAKRFLDTKNLSLVSYTVQEWQPRFRTSDKPTDPCSIHVSAFRYDELIKRVLKRKGYQIVDDRQMAALDFHYQPSCNGGCSRSHINGKIEAKESQFDDYNISIHNRELGKHYYNYSSTFHGPIFDIGVLRLPVRGIQSLIGMGRRGIIRHIPSCKKFYSKDFND